MKKHPLCNLILAASSLLVISSAHAASGTWDTNADGNWSGIANWTGNAAYAEGEDSIATLGNFISVDRVINLDISILLGGITALDTSNNYTISGPGVLTLATSTGQPAPVISVVQSRTLTIASEIAGNDGLMMAGNGILALTGTNSYTGTTTIKGGTLNLGGGTSTGSLASTALALNGGTLSYTRTDSQIKNFTAGTTINAGASSVTADAGNTIGLGAITRSTVGGTLAVGATGTITTSSSNDATGILGAWVTYDIGANMRYATVSGGNIVGYTGTTGDTEGTWVDAAVNYETAVTGTASRTLTTSRSVNTFRYSGAGTAGINLGASGSNTFTTNGILNAGTNTLTISRSGGTGSVVAGNTGEIVIAGQSAITISAPISSGAVTYSGTGTLILSGANTYTGGFTLNSGIVSVGASTTNYEGFGAGKMTWNGGQITTNNAAVVTIANEFELNGATLTAQTGSGTLNFGGIVTLKQNINFTGTSSTTDTRFVFNNAVGDGGNGFGLSLAAFGGSGGGFTFNAVNTFTGDITIGTAGTSGKSRTLIIGNNGSLNSGDYSGNISNGNSTGSITYSSSANQILRGVISGSAKLIKDTSSTSTLTLTGTNTYTGTTTVTAGTLLATKAASLSGYTTASKIIFNGGTIAAQVGGAGWTTTQVDTLLTNATKTSGALGIDTTNGSLTQWTAFTTTNLGSTLGLTKLGTNTLTLDQVNNYTGNTTVSDGTLVLQDNAQLRFVIGTDGVNNSILGTGVLTLDGDFMFDLTGASTTALDAWNIVDVTNLSETYGSTFSLLSTNGSFIESLGIWTIAENGTTYQFEESTGVLMVIPEPRAALLGSIGILLLLRRRR